MSSFVKKNFDLFLSFPQIDLDPRYEDSLGEYRAGLDQFHLTEYVMETKIEFTAATAYEPAEDEGLSIEVENASENEIKIAIKAKPQPLKPQQPAAASDAAKRRSGGGSKAKKINSSRLRAYSESCCDQLKVISESECLKLSSSAVNGGGGGGGGCGPNTDATAGGNNKVRKTRSISESYHESNQSREEPIIKYKSILKHSYDHQHSFSMDSSVDDLFSVSFGDYGHSATDQELSESCKKSVRFSDHITRQLYK